jgi:probable addiction module antidote protein
MAIRTTRWDAVDHMKTRDNIAHYLEAVLEDGDPELLKLALGDVARTPIAKEAGLPPLPDDVVRALSLVLRTLGIGLSAARETQAAE